MIKIIFCSILVGAVGVVAFVAGAVKRQKVIEIVRIIQFLLYYPLLVRKSGVREDKLNNNAWYQYPPLIWAHAGGADPVLYGNAQENFDKAIENGYCCLEADVGLTTDGVPVMTHLFRPNFENLYSGVPTSAEFLATRIDDRYTPLTLRQFIERYKNYDGWIFLDGLSFGPKARFDFRKYFSSVDDKFKQKIIVQVFMFKDLLSLKRDNPFGGIHFSGIFGIGTNQYIRPMLIKALKSCGVKSVSLSDFEIVGADISDTVAEFRRNDIVVSVAGVNTLSQYRRLLKLGVNCIDTDYLTPANIKGI